MFELGMSSKKSKNDANFKSPEMAVTVFPMTNSNVYLDFGPYDAI